MARSRKRDQEEPASPAEGTAAEFEMDVSPPPVREVEPAGSIATGALFAGSHLEAARQRYFGSEDADENSPQPMTAEEKLLHAIFGPAALEEGPAPKRRSKMKMSKSAKQVVQELMPDMEVVEPVKHLADVQQALPPDAVSPELSALRKKYFGATDAEDDAAFAEAAQKAAAEGGIDSGIVLVRPKNAPADPAHPSVKAVVVANGRIIGRQG